MLNFLCVRKNEETRGNLFEWKIVLGDFSLSSLAYTEVGGDKKVFSQPSPPKVWSKDIFPTVSTNHKWEREWLSEEVLRLPFWRIFEDGLVQSGVPPEKRLEKSNQKRKSRLIAPEKTSTRRGKYKFALVDFSGDLSFDFKAKSRFKLVVFPNGPKTFPSLLATFLAFFRFSFVVTQHGKIQDEF